MWPPPNPHAASSHLPQVAVPTRRCRRVSKARAPTVFVPHRPQRGQAFGRGDGGWNSQVSHILATASQSGATIVWDLRQKKPWCELRDAASRSPVSDVAWNPLEGLHLATASGDDGNPVVRLWDLRSSTTMPLGTLRGHTQGILSIDWCPDDTALLASCAGQQEVAKWDPSTQQAVYEIPGGGANPALPKRRILARRRARARPIFWWFRPRNGASARPLLVEGIKWPGVPPNKASWRPAPSTAACKYIKSRPDRDGRSGSGGPWRRLRLWWRLASFSQIQAQARKARRGSLVNASRAFEAA